MISWNLSQSVHRFCLWSLHEVITARKTPAFQDHSIFFSNCGSIIQDSPLELEVPFPSFALVRARGLAEVHADVRAGNVVRVGALLYWGIYLQNKSKEIITKETKGLQFYWVSKCWIEIVGINRQIRGERRLDGLLPCLFWRLWRCCATWRDRDSPCRGQGIPHWTKGSTLTGYYLLDITLHFRDLIF